jgi:hypothetical protein
VFGGAVMYAAYLWVGRPQELRYCLLVLLLCICATGLQVGMPQGLWRCYVCYRLWTQVCEIEKMTLPCHVHVCSTNPCLPQKNRRSTLKARGEILREEISVTGKVGALMRHRGPQTHPCHLGPLCHLRSFLPSCLLARSGRIPPAKPRACRQGMGSSIRSGMMTISCAPPEMAAILFQHCH